MSKAKKNIIRTSNQVASKAGKQLQAKSSSENEKSVAASALGNRKPKTTKGSNKNPSRSK